MNKLLFLVSILIILAKGAMAQGTNEPGKQKYLVYFKDKAGTPYTLQEPEKFLSPKSIARRSRQQIALTTRDLPVNPAYISGIKQLGIEVWYSSRWFNAAVIACTPTELEDIQQLTYVQGSRVLNRLRTPVVEKADSKINETYTLASLAPIPANSKEYGLSFHQANMLGAVDLHTARFTGEGMTIAVLDAGFPGVNTIPAFAHLFQNNQLKGTFDFVQKKENVYTASSHGTSVLSTMGAYEPNKIIGTAYNANYLLLRTEDAASEHHIEEINWLLAAEYADSAGADVINSSLGYSLFDAPSVSYTYQQMDGNTTLVAKAADIAAATGMLVVVSAGNDGTKPWRYIASPADADSVLAVGAVDSLGVKAAFSSFGPTADGQVKPDVVALGQNAYVLNQNGTLVKSNGTSFSGPIIAGFAASLWQANASKTNREMIQLIRQLGSQATAPDNALGYGIPKYKKNVTGLPDLLIEKGIYITNPVGKDKIALSYSEEWSKQAITVSVFDVTGKLVFTQQLTPGTKQQILALDPQLLQKGVYLCRIRSGNMAETLRFVKL